MTCVSQGVQREHKVEGMLSEPIMISHPCLSRVVFQLWDLSSKVVDDHFWIIHHSCHRSVYWHHHWLYLGMLPSASVRSQGALEKRRCNWRQLLPGNLPTIQECASCSNSEHLLSESIRILESAKFHDSLTCKLYNMMIFQLSFKLSEYSLIISLTISSLLVQYL